MTAERKPSLLKPLMAFVGLCAVVVLLVVAAVLVKNDAADTVLGFFTGMLAVGMLASAIVVVLRRRLRLRLRDEEILDRFDPLRRGRDEDPRDAR